MARKMKSTPPEAAGLPETIVVEGKERVLAVPTYGIREALVKAAGEMPEKGSHADMTGRRIAAAALGACVPSYRPQGLTWALVDFNVLSFGDAVYDHLRSRGMGVVEIVSVGVDLLKGMSGGLHPIAQKEVDQTAGFSEGEASRTSPDTD